MRICYLQLTRYPTRQANAVHVMNMCAAMAEVGHEVTLVIRASKNAERGFETTLHDRYGVSDSFTIRVIPDHQFLVRRQIQRQFLKGLLADLRPNLIYSRTTKFARLWTNLGIPYIYETHVMPRHHPRLSMTKTALLSRNFLRLVVITHSLAEDFRSAFPELHSDAILVAPDAATVKSVVPLADRHGFCAGYVGHLYPGKGMETIAAIAPRLPEVRFDVVGGLAADIQAWRKRTSHVENIQFVGHVPHREVCRHIAGFDLALAPFGRRIEAQKREISNWFSPLKIFEYMARSRPIIAADLPVLREVLEHGRNALLVPPNDADAWVGAIRMLREDSAMRTRLGRAAFEDLKRHYTWSARARAVLKNLPL